MEFLVTEKKPRNIFKPFHHHFSKGSNGMESMESSSGGGGTGTLSVIPEQFRNRKKCVGYTTAIFGIVILLVIVASVHHDGEDGVSLRNLPAAFSSASSGSGSNGNSVVDSRRVSLADTSRGRFYPSHWNGSWISDVEFLYRDNSGWYTYVFHHKID